MQSLTTRGSQEKEQHAQAEVFMMAYTVKMINAGP